MTRIGIDGFSLSRNDSGIEVYTRQLLRGVVDIHPVELYTMSDSRIKAHANLRVRSSNLNSPGTIAKLKWELFDISRLVSADVGIFHSPHFILPYNNPAPRKVVTVHDLAFIRHPEFFDWKTKLYYRMFLERSLREADAIICISKSCLDDVAAFFPSVKSRLHLVHNGFKNFSNVPVDETIFSKLGIQSPFILMIGTLNPRKNLANAISAFRSFAKGKDLELIIVGSIPRERLPVDDADPRIKLTGYISESELSALYHKAEVLLYPSFYEGFGFPILEAMSAGTPVLTSAVSSMPEVSGYPEELLCDPADPQSIERLLAYFLSPANRAFLKNHGTFAISRFSWDNMIAGTSAVYELLQEDL